MDSNYIFRSLTICPGSNNDQHVWKYSEIRDTIQELRENENICNEEGKYYLIGTNSFFGNMHRCAPYFKIEFKKRLQNIFVFFLG